MGKRPARPKPELDAEVDRMCEEDADLGVSADLDDLVTWVDDDYDFQFSYWKVALETIDQRQDTRLLLQLLRQDSKFLEKMQEDYKHGWYFTDELTARVRLHLADLLHRHNLIRQPWCPRRAPAETRAPWHQTFDAIYAKDDKKPLMNLLRSDTELTSTDCCHLADLLEAYELRHRKGRQQTPSYVFSEKEAVKFAARQQVSVLVKEHKCDVETAIAKTALDFGIKRSTLRNSYGGRDGNTNRARRAKKGRPGKEAAR